MSKTKDATRTSKADKSMKNSKGVVKPVDDAKSNKKAAVAVATKVEKSDKKSKKSKKAPTPEPESESESSASESDVESSSASSDSEAEAKASKSKAVNGGTQGKPAANGKGATSSSEEESDSEGSESESAGKGKAAAKAQPAAVDSSESDSSEDEKPQASAGEKPKKAVAVNGTSKEDSSDESSEGSDSAGSEGSESDEESEAEAKTEVAVSKKRKADDAVEPSAKKAKSDLPANAAKTLFVGNLSWNVDDAFLSESFSKFGEVLRANVMTSRDDGRSKGFGFVEYGTLEEAVEAHNNMKGSELDGRELNVDYTQPRGENNDRKASTNDRASKFGDVKSKPSNTIWCGNVAFSVTAETLQSAFEEYGTVTRVSLPTDRETGQMKGFAYIDMTNVDEAQKAFDALNGQELEGRAVRLDFAQPRDQSGGGGGGRGFGGGRGGGGFGGRGGGRGRGGFGGRGGGDRGRGGRGGGRGRGASTNRGGIGDFSGQKVTF